MRILFSFLRELFSSVWGIIWVTLSVISTISTYVFTLSSSYHVHRWIPWIPLVVSLVAWFLAPFHLYRRKQREIVGLRVEVAKLGTREPELVIHPEPNSRYYIEVQPNDRNKVRGVYVELRLTVENKGEINSVVRRFDLSIDETGGDHRDLQPMGRNSIQTRSGLHAGLNCDLIVERNTVVVPAHDVRAGCLPIYLNDAPPISSRELHCTLTMTDTVGTQARAKFTVTNAE